MTKKIAYMGWIEKNIGDLAGEQGFLKLAEDYDVEVVSSRVPAVDINWDLVVLGCGNLLSCWPNEWLDKLDYNLVAKNKCAIFATGANEYRGGYQHEGKVDELYKTTLVNHVDLCEYVALRDTHSIEIMESLGVKRKIEFVPDLAFGLEYEENNYLANKYNIDFKEKTILYSPHFSDVVGKTENNMYVVNQVDLLKTLIKGGFKIIICPVIYVNEQLAEVVYEILNDKKNSVLVKRAYDYDLNCFLTLLKKSSFVIGVKLHTAVLSTLVGTPFINIAYKHKNYDFCRMIGYDQGILPLDFKVEDAIWRFGEIYVNREQISQHFNTMTARFKPLLKQKFAELMKVVA